MNLHDRFEQYSDDFLKFDKVENKRCQRPDLHAFLLLDELQPSKRDMVSGAEHDEIWLDVDCEELEKIITDEQIEELVRSGVRFDDDCECLCMFV